ncbi:MAG: D-amino-acid dehydrogenase [Rhizobacter sp.]|nr:D-amino-acid dehydrogenase [Rhizobacter sp.]
MNRSVAIIGAGMVGVACALELQRRSFDVTLFDRSAPGSETSYGNAGVIARSSLIPFNNPGLWRALPKLLRNEGASFRYDPSFLAKNVPWALGFLARARRRVFDETTAALDSLIRLSTTEHRRLMNEAGVGHRLRENGWIFLYRSEAAFEAGSASRGTMARFGVNTQALDARELHDLEPHLNPIFPRALWVKDASSVDNPGEVVKAYAKLFVARGGALRQAQVARLDRSNGGDGGDGGAGSVRWLLSEDGGTTHQASRVVIALGPWSREFMQRTLGIRVAMAFERGTHMHYGAQAGAMLTRPVYDTGGGYVLSPMEQGLRLTTGVPLAARDAPIDTAQLDLAERSARQAFPLAGRLDTAPWLGSRPTLPDSRPIIDQCPGHPGLWLAFGHQHIGFATGPGTAALLGALMTGEAGAIDATPFRAGRFA